MEISNYKFIYNQTRKGSILYCLSANMAFVGELNIFHLKIQQKLAERVRLMRWGEWVFKKLFRHLLRTYFSILFFIPNTCFQPLQATACWRKKQQFRVFWIELTKSYREYLVWQRSFWQAGLTLDIHTSHCHETGDILSERKENYLPHCSWCFIKKYCLYELLVLYYL